MSPGSISFNDTANLRKSHKLTVTNHGDSTASFKLINRVSVSILPFNASGDYSVALPPVYRNDSAKLRFSRKAVKIAPGKSVEITVSVIPPKTDPDLHVIYGGFVEFKSELDRHKDITVPYMGIVGNQIDIPIYPENTPLLVNGNATVYYNKTDVYEYPISKNTTDQPQVAVVLNMGSRMIRTILQTDKGENVGLNPIPVQEYVSRSIGDAYSLNPWDGYYLPFEASDEDLNYVEAKPGHYRIVVQALRLLGNVDNKDDWETWISPVIHIT